MTRLGALHPEYLERVGLARLEPQPRVDHPPRILRLYGSLRPRSFRPFAGAGVRDAHDLRRQLDRTRLQALERGRAQCLHSHPTAHFCFHAGGLSRHADEKHGVAVPRQVSEPRHCCGSDPSDGSPSVRSGRHGFGMTDQGHATIVTFWL